MKLTEQILQEYNTSEALLVVSSFPKIGETYSQGVCAVASFTKNTLESVKAQNPNKKIAVLSMILQEEEIYQEDGMLIIRCFSRNKPLTYLSLLSYTRQFNLVKNVLVEFEFATFGDTLTTFLLSSLIWILYLMGKRINLVIHQVILDLAKLSGHIGVSKNSPLIKIFNCFLRLYYKLISLPVSSIIVLEDGLKNRLSAFINPNKIYVIPHGVHTTIQNPNLNQTIYYKDEFVVLYFGYMTWYKGVDFLINAFKKIQLNGKRIHLLLAGGPSFTQYKKRHYQKFYQSIVKSVKNIPQITLTGFVEEQKIPSYFAGADVVVFPYRTFMSSSGSLATTLSFKKPFLISKNLSPLLDSEDIADCLTQLKIKKEELLFDLTEESFCAALNKVMNSENLRKLQQLSSLIKSRRSFENLSADYADLLFPKQLEKPLINLALDNI